MLLCAFLECEFLVLVGPEYERRNKVRSSVNVLE